MSKNIDPARQLAAEKVGENGKGGKEGGNITVTFFFGGVKTEGVFFFSLWGSEV